MASAYGWVTILLYCLWFNEHIHYILTVGTNGGYHQSIGGPHAIFFIFHEILGKGGRPSSNGMVNVGCGLSKGGLSKLEMLFST